jgi:ABC-type branched-subunit amino acid transport system substrate-binding protein
LKIRSLRRTLVVLVAVAGLVALTVTASLASAANDAAAPIKLMEIVTVNTIAQNLPEEQAGATAAVNAINKTGGMSGHKVVMETCNDQYNPNQAATCAHQAVSDGVAAVFGNSVFSPEIVPVLAAAHIPMIGLQGANPIDYTDPDSYEWFSSAADWFTAMPGILKKEGVHKVTQLVSNLPAVLALAKLFAAPEHALGLQDGGQVQAPNNSTDYLPFAQAVKSSGGDGVAMIIQAAQITAYFTAANQLGALKGIHYIDLPGHYPPSVIQSLKPIIATGNLNLVLISPLPPVAATKKYPAVGQYIKDVQTLNKATHMNGSTTYDATSLGYWTDVQLIKTLVGMTKGAITGQALINTLNHAKNINISGFFKWTPAAPGPANEPHLSNHAVFLEVLNTKGGIVSAPDKLFHK